MTVFELVVGWGGVKMCDFCRDLSQERPQITPWANFPDSEYAALNIYTFGSSIQILGPIGGGDLGR